MMKTIKSIILAGLLFPLVTLAAPYFHYEDTTLPLRNNSYDLGTSTSVWRNLYLNLSDGCLQSVSNLITSTGSACGAGGSGNSFAYPFPGDATTTVITFSSGLVGNVTGNVSGTAGSLGANGTNCSSGNYPLGVDASGNSESCTSVASTTLLSDVNTFSTTATTTFSGGIRGNLLNITSTTASSTFANGINLTGGCFSINGTCISGGGGGSGTLTGNGIAGTMAAWTSSTNLVSTSTIIGELFIATSTTSTSTFAGGLNVGNGGLVYDWYNGTTSIASLQTGNLNFETDAGLVSWVNLPLSVATNSTPEGYTAYLNGSSTISVYGLSSGSGWLQSDYPRVSIGQTAAGVSTPTAKLTVYANGTGSNTALEVLNSSAASLFKILDNGNVGISTSTPGTPLGVTGAGVFTGQVTGLNFYATSTTATSTFLGKIGTVRLTTDSIRSTDLVSCDTIDTDASGNFRCGTDTSGAGGGTYPFTPATNYAVNNNATTGIVWFQSGFNASSTSHLDYASTTQLTIDSLLKIPASSNPTLNITGQIAINTASSSVKFYDGNRSQSIYSSRTSSTIYASSSLSFDGRYGASGTTTYILANYPRTMILKTLYCKVTSGSGTAYVTIGTGTATSTVNCSTSGVESTTQVTFNQRDNYMISIGGKSGDPNLLTVTDELLEN